MIKVQTNCYNKRNKWGEPARGKTGRATARVSNPRSIPDAIAHMAVDESGEPAPSRECGVVDGAYGGSPERKKALPLRPGRWRLTTRTTSLNNTSLTLSKKEAPERSRRRSAFFLYALVPGRRSQHTSTPNSKVVCLLGLGKSTDHSLFLCLCSHWTQSNRHWTQTAV